MAKIYISSTYGDLKDYREAVYRRLRQMQHDVIAMEDYVAADQRPLDKCLQDVDECDLYVGIFAWRYGYIPDKDNPENRSITELEYRQAEKSGIARLLFILDENAAWSPKFMDWKTGEGDNGKRIDDFRKELGREKLVSFFTTPDDLAGKSGAAVHNWEKEQDQQQASAEETFEKPAASPAFQPREIRYHAFVAYAGADQEYVEQLAYHLAQQRRRSLLLAPRALFAQQTSEFQHMEDGVRQCHTALIVLSDRLFQHMQTQRDQFDRIRRILHDRTGHVFFVGRSEDSLKKAESWELKEVIDGSGWNPQPDAVVPIDLIVQIEQAFSQVCPASRKRTVGLPCMISR